MNIVLKNTLFLLIITITIFIPTHALKSLKNAAPAQEALFLASLKKRIIEQKNKRIARLERSKKSKKRAKAEELKRRKHLDHIKIVTEDGTTTYLQLENSRSGYFGGRSHPYDQQKLAIILQELCKKHGLTLQNVTEISVYLSTKQRKNCILGSWWTNNDLYSAAFYLGTTKAENPTRRDFIRNLQRRQI